MKKNTRKVLVGSLALLTAVSMGSVSGTYARYTSDIIDKTDLARVAKWQLNKSTTIDDLFAVSYKVSDDDTKTDVLSTDKVVAPGTSGSYEFSLSGEVETNYTIDATISATDTINTDEYAPIVYTLDGTEVTDLDGDGVVTAKDLAKAIENLYKAADGTTQKVYAAGTVSESKHTIGWSWAIDGDDAKDTALGNDATANVSLNVKLTATQSEKAAN